MSHAFRQLTAALLVCAWSMTPAFAQDADVKRAAKAHFDAGNGLLARGDVAAALGEFQQSRALFPTRGNTLNAAIALQRLGRFDEALELYLTLPRDFTLDAEQRQRVEREVELLRALTGKLTIRAEPGTSVSIDGRDRGTSPFAEPLLVLGGSHNVRAQKPGFAPFERRVDIVTDAEQQLVIVLAPPSPEAPPPSVEQKPALAVAPAPVAADVAPPPSPPERTKSAQASLVLSLDLGFALGTGFGGPLADSCGSGCSGSVPLGFSGRVRGGYQPGPAAELGLELGYVRLSGDYRARPDTLEPIGAGPQPGLSRDDITWSSWSFGGYAAWHGAGRLHALASLGLGFSFARVSDERRGDYHIEPPVGDAYDAAARATQSGRSTALYLAPELGLGLNVAPRVEVGLSLSLLSSIVLSAARFERPSVVVENAAGEKELAYFRRDDLTGGAFFALVPRLGVRARF